MKIRMFAAVCVCLLALGTLMAGCGGGGGGASSRLLAVIAYMHRAAGGDQEVWLMKLDGSDKTQIAAVAGEDCIQGALSPDGRKLAYVQQDATTSKLVIKDLKTGATTVVLTDPTSGGNDFAPAWSPDGTKIAYRDDRDNSVHVMNADGSGDAQITPGDDEHAPSWSKKGDKLIYDKGWNGSIAVCNASDGSDETIILPDTVHSYGQPQFLPDGRIIAMRNTSGGSKDIVICNADGSDETVITPDTDASDEFFPSCYRTKVAYASDVTGQKDCFIATLSGSTLTDVTNLTADDDEDSWRPKLGVIDTSYVSLP